LISVSAASGPSISPRSSGSSVTSSVGSSGAVSGSAAFSEKRPQPAKTNPSEMKDNQLLSVFGM
jgi:hypothetical protein